MVKQQNVGLYCMNVFCLVDDDIEDLNEQLIGLQQTRELEKEQAHATIQQIKTELQETKDQLTSDNMILGKCNYPFKSYHNKCN